MRGLRTSPRGLRGTSQRAGTRHGLLRFWRVLPLYQPQRPPSEQASICFKLRLAQGMHYEDDGAQRMQSRAPQADLFDSQDFDTDEVHDRGQSSKDQAICAGWSNPDSGCRGNAAAARRLVTPHVVFPSISSEARGQAGPQPLPVAKIGAVWPFTPASRGMIGLDESTITFRHCPSRRQRLPA